MSAPADRVNRSSLEHGEEEEEIILLTEVVEEPPSETVLNLTSGERELDSLFPGELSAGGPESPPEVTLAGEELDDFLASLKDLPEDLGASASAPPAPRAEPPGLHHGLEEAVRRELAAFLQSPRFREMLQEVLQDMVEKMSQDLLPRMAAQVLEQKVAKIFKRLEED